MKHPNTSHLNRWGYMGRMHPCLSLTFSMSMTICKNSPVKIVKLPTLARHISSFPSVTLQQIIITTHLVQRRPLSKTVRSRTSPLITIIPLEVECLSFLPVVYHSLFMVCLLWDVHPILMVVQYNSEYTDIQLSSSTSFINRSAFSGGGIYCEPNVFAQRKFDQSNIL